MGGLALASLCVNALFLSRRRVEGMGGASWLEASASFTRNGLVWFGDAEQYTKRQGSVRKLNKVVLCVTASRPRHTMVLLGSARTHHLSLGCPVARSQSLSLRLSLKSQH